MAKELVDFSRTQVQSLIQNGYAVINEKPIKAGYKVETGEDVIVYIPKPENTDILPEDVPLDVVYEGQDVIVINKPTGMIVHPSIGIYNGTLVNALLYHCHDLSGINSVTRPGIVHRIGRETSGLLMVAKNDKAHQSLSK